MTVSAPAHYPVRRRLWHFARGQCGDPRSYRPRRINATSAMVVAPSFSGAEADALRAAAADRAAIGLHVTLTAPFRPLTPLRTAARRRVPAAGGDVRRGLARMLTPALLEAEIARAVRGIPRCVWPCRPTTSTAISTSTCSRRSARHLSASRTKRRRTRWLRQCGRAVRHSLEPKGLVLDALSRRFRRSPRKRADGTNAAFAGTYGFRPGADYTNFSRISRRPARRRPCHVSSGPRRRRTRTARSAYRFARARIRVFSRRRVSAIAG